MQYTYTLYRWAAYFPLFRKAYKPLESITYATTITTTDNNNTYTNTNNAYFKRKYVYCPQTWFQPYKLSKIRFRAADMFPPTWRQVSIYGGIFI